MNTNMIINKLSTKQNGSFFNIEVVTDVPLCAAAKRNGHNCYKKSLMNVRKGISYKKMKAVREKYNYLSQEEFDAKKKELLGI